MSEFGSSVAEKKRLIIRNPDGSYSHLLKNGERDSTTETKALLNRDRNVYNNDVLTVSDEELQYIIENYENLDHNNILEEIISVFRKNQMILLLFIIFELTLSSFLLFVTWKKKEGSILIMQSVYKDISSFEAMILFYSIFFTCVVLNLVYYPLAFYSMMTKKVKIFKVFTTYSLYTSIVTIFIIYINIMFIFVFLLRLVIYGIAKFVVNLLVSLLILPRTPTLISQFNNQYNTL